MTTLRPFAVELFDEILKDIYVVKPDLSFYYEMCEQTVPNGIAAQIKQFVRNFMRWFKTVRVELDNHSLRESISKWDPYWDRLQYFYEHLCDETSRTALVKVVAHRLLGPLHVTLPADTPEYRDLYRRAQELEERTNSIDAGFRSWRLYQMNLNSYGYPITLMNNAVGIHAIFGMKQYEFRNEQGLVIGVEPGDSVIDAGGCWGDTALFFAHAAGPTGRVFSFEFVPSNLQIFEGNLKLNPSLAERIEIVRRPVWNESGHAVSIESDGPATKVNLASGQVAPSSLLTTTIDDLVSERRLQSVNLIKMDIEGAELPALRGAVDTLRRFKPKLAIALYHSLEDLVDIPRWIADLGLGYRLHLGHKTIFDAETVLFADAT